MNGKLCWAGGLLLAVSTMGVTQAAERINRGRPYTGPCSTLIMNFDIAAKTPPVTCGKTNTATVCGQWTFQGTYGSCNPATANVGAFCCPSGDKLVVINANGPNVSGDCCK